MILPPPSESFESKAWSAYRVRELSQEDYLGRLNKRLAKRSGANESLTLARGAAEELRQIANTAEEREHTARQEAALASPFIGCIHERNLVSDPEPSATESLLTNFRISDTDDIAEHRNKDSEYSFSTQSAIYSSSDSDYDSEGDIELLTDGHRASVGPSACCEHCTIQ